MAFTIGEQFIPGDSGYKIIAAHTDSPHLKLAPITKSSSCGF